MKKQFVIDTDKEFIKEIKSLSNPKKVEVETFTSGNTALSLIDIENPALVFLNLDVSDVNEFIVHDLLKKCNIDFSIPIIITYSEKSENDLNKYKVLMYKAKEYLKKPISDSKLKNIVASFLGNDGVKEETTEKPEKEVKMESSKDHTAKEEADDIEKETDSLFDTLLQSTDESSEKEGKRGFKIDDTLVDVEDFFTLDEEPAESEEEKEDSDTKEKLSKEKKSNLDEEEAEEKNVEFEALDKKLKEKEKEFEDNLKIMINEKEDLIEELKAELKEKDKSLKTEMNQHEKDKTSIESEFKDKIDSLSASVKEKEEEIDELKSQIVSLTKKNTSLENELSSIKKNQDKHADEFNELKEAFEKIEELLDDAVSLISKKKKKFK